MKRNTAFPRAARGGLALALSCCLAAVPALAACSQGEGGGGSAAQLDVDVEEGEEEEPSFTAHGSTYEKAETVTVNTDYDGEVEEASVSEWIKNPEGKDEVRDVSSLQAIDSDDEDASFTQDDEEVTWQTGGEDVNYTGVTDEELPFEVSVTFKIDGEEVSPEELEGATGRLKIRIRYKNKTHETVEVDGEEVEVQQPYVMASIVAFDSEHARNVEVDNGTVMDQDGSFIAVGVGMPGLAETLGVEDSVDLPESVAITADVKGFSAPSVTTMVTNQALGSIDEESLGEADESVEEAFDELGGVQEAVETLGQGVEGVDEALATINEGQEKLDDAFPNATDGLDKLGQLSEAVSAGASGSEELVGASGDALDVALAQLSLVDASSLDAESAQALQTAMASLEGAQQANEAAETALGKTATAADTLTAGLESATDGLEQMQEGYEQLEKATGTVNKATTKLSKAVETMGEGIEDALEEAETQIDDELALIAALNGLVEDTGAFCGNADDMPASTTFVLTAGAE